MATQTRSTLQDLTFIHLLVILLILKSVQISRANLYPSRISSGVYEQDLTSDTIFYDSFLSIIFEYKVPTWNTIDITLRDWRGICKTDTFSPSYTCPVFFYLERFIERMQSELVTLSSITSLGQHASTISNNITNRCTRIQKHFSTMLTSKVSMENYITSLTTECHLRGHVVKRLVNDYLYNIKTIYSSMVRKFEAEFPAKPANSTDKKGPAFYVNQITAAQGLMLFNYFFEKNRWDNAIKSCTMRVIPSSLVKSSNLTDALTQIETEAKSQGYSLSIPINNTASYLMSHLTDCTFTSSPVDSFVVRIQIPILRDSFKPKLIRLKSIPFLLDTNNQNSQQEDMGPSICQIFDNLSGTYLYEESTGYLTPSNCQPELGSNLCQVPTSSFRTLPNLCASAYFARTLSTIKKYCRLQCELVVDNLAPLPIFSRVSSDTFIVTGNSDTQVNVKCPGKRVQIVNPDKLGSIEVILPCKCSLNFHSNIFLSEQPCGDELIMTHITPIQFFSQQFVQEFNPETDNFTGIINRTMMDSIYFDTKHMAKSNKVAGQIDLNTGSSALGQTQQLQQENENENDRAVSMSQSHSSITSLWIFIILQTIIFTMFIIFALLKFGMFSAYTSSFYSRDPRLSYTNERNSHFSVSSQHITDSRVHLVQDDSACHL